MTATHLSEGRTGLFIFILQRTLTSDRVSRRGLETHFCESRCRRF